MFRLSLSVILLAFALALNVRPAHADEPQPPFFVNGICDEFLYLQSVLAAEGLAQPLEAHIEMSRVLLSKPPCFLDRGWISSWGAATDYLANPLKYANSKTHFLKYYQLTQYLTPAQREPLAVAAHLALTEPAPFELTHFDTWGSEAGFFSNPKSCHNVFGWRTIRYDNGTVEYIPIRWFIIGGVKFC